MEFVSYFTNISVIKAETETESFRSEASQLTVLPWAPIDLPITNELIH
jgi:hypothetical protein